MSFGLVLIPCVNALACQCVGNLEFVGCYWRIPGTITSLAQCVKTCVMWNVSDVAGVFLALSLSLAQAVPMIVIQNTPTQPPHRPPQEAMASTTASGYEQPQEDTPH